VGEKSLKVRSVYIGETLMEANAHNSEALKALGNRIRNLRNAHGLSQMQLADSVGMSARYLGEVEAGKRNVSFGRLKDLAVHLSVPLPELLDFEEPEARSTVLKQLHEYLEDLPLDQLLFLQRVFRQFMRQEPSRVLPRCVDTDGCRR
jgi:transcriptional regulator with XRE-family HTH domain